MEKGTPVRVHRPDAQKKTFPQKGKGSPEQENRFPQWVQAFPE
jgi:hypothetical protein